MRTRPQCCSVASITQRIMQRGTHGVLLALLVAAMFGPANRLHAQNVAMPPAEATPMDAGAAPVTDYGSVNFFSQDLGTMLRLRYNTESYGQDQRGNFDIGSMQVLTFDDSAAFVDGQVTMNEVNGVGFNIGTGYRWLNTPFFEPTGRVDGISIWADGTHTDAGNFFPQIGVSYESLGDLWDLRGNMYIPLGPQDKVGNFTPTGEIGFAGFSLSQLTQATVDSSYTVGELELARRLGAERDAWAFAGPYFITNDNDNTAGYRIGVRGYAYPDLLLQIAVSDDEIFHTNAAFQVQWFVGRTRSNFQPTGTVADRMREPVMRNDYVTLSKSTRSGPGQSLRNSDGSALRIVHVDSSAAAGGNGSFEHPFNELDQAGGTGSQTGDIILAHSQSTLTTSILLKDNQKLLGEGNNFNNQVTTLEEGTVSLPASSPGAISRARPIIATAMGDAVTLAVSNEVANFDFNGTMARAITAGASGAGNPNLHDLAISNTTGDAIFFAPATVTDPNNAANQIVRGNVTINNVTFTDIGGNDIHINSFTPTNVTLPTVTLQEAIAISNVASTNGTGPAINIENTHTGTGHTTTLSNFTYDGGTTSAGAIRLSNFDGTFNASNSTLSNGATTGSGVAVVSDSDGTINFASTVAFTSLDGTSFRVGDETGGTDDIDADITVGGAITNDTGRSISVRNLASGGTFNMNGNVTDSGKGILIDDNGGGTVTFIGDLAMTIDTADTAVTVSANNAATNIDFAGDVVINATGTANGFFATGGGTISAPGTVNSISVATGQALKITGMNIANANVRFGDINRTAAAASTAIDLEDNTGASTSAAIVIGNTTDTHGQAGTLQGGAANVVVVKDSANVSITGLDIVNNAAFEGVHVEKSSTAAMTTNLSDIQVSGGSEGINVVGGGTGALTMTINDAIVQNQVNFGLHFNNVDNTGTTPIQVNNALVDGDPTIAGARGVRIQDSNGSITFDSATQIKEWGNTDFEVFGITASPTPGTISYAGKIINDRTANASDTTGNSVHIHNNAAGTVTFTTASSIKDTNEGMLVTQNTGGTFTFSGNNTFDTSSNTNTAVTITNNTGASVSLGDLHITTSDGQGLVATGGGSLTVTGFGNTITRSTSLATGAALDIEGMTIGAVDFESVNAEGGQNGIRLVDNTGGTVTIGDTGNSAGAGGVIGSTAATATADQGVFVRNTNVTLNGVTVDHAGDAANENAVEILHTNSTAMNANLNRLTVNNTGPAVAARDGVVIDGTGGTGTFNANVQNMVVDTTGDGFVANSGVTLTAGGTNTIDSDTGVGLTLTNIAVSGSGANFAHVNVSAGATNAIKMQSVTGGTVTVGSSSGAAASGGVLNALDDAIVLQNVQSAAINQVQIASAGNAAGDNGVEITHNNAATTAMDITIDGLQVTSAFDSAINVTSANTNNFNLRLTDGTYNNNVNMSLQGAGHVGLLVDNTTITTGNNDVAFALVQSSNARNVDATFQNGNNFTTGDAQALMIEASGATAKTFNLLVEGSTFHNNSGTDATAEISALQSTTMNATVRANTFQNLGAANNYVTTSDGAAVVMNLSLGGTSTDKNVATGGLAEYRLNELNGSDFNVFDKTNTFNNTRNTGTVNPQPNAAAFDDLATPPTLPTIP